MIDTKGMITVAEAAKRLNRSIEQVRRKLREGKLKGQRIGNQWFVEETSVNGESREPKRLFSEEFVQSVYKLRQEITTQNGGRPLDVVEMLRKSREAR